MPDPWKPEREWMVDEVRDIVRAQCPGVPCDFVEPFGSGWDNAAFLVDDQWIFRFSQRKIAIPLLVTEWNVLPQLALRMPVPIPHPKWFGYVDEWSLLGYAKLKGVPASNLAMNDRSRFELARSLGKFLRLLHDQPFDDLRVEPDPLNRLDTVSRRPRAIAMLDECDEAIDAGPLRRILDDVDPTPGDIVLSHGDLYSRHLLIDQRQLSGVIDWGDVCLADPAHDLMLPFCVLPPEARTDFFAEYGQISLGTASRARFRAIGHALNVYRYAKSIGDQSLLAETILSLKFIVA